ncbi:MAG: DUF3782 domain-containing protein [bacterium]|nr:DUF3782 domain-containing protein [bacterium]
MDTQTIKRIIREELPGLMKRDRSIRQFILQLSQEQVMEVADRTGKLESVTESKFDRMMNELKTDREEQNRKWDKNQEEIHAMIQEMGQLREKNEEEHKESRRDLKQSNDRIHASISAIGSRWGIRSEATFRNAIKGILEDFDIEVKRVDEPDDEGIVFGRPDRVELDLIIINGKLLIGELKSSMSKPDMFNFFKKAQFYEKRHNRKADRRVVISPMVDDHARRVAEELGITIYSHADDLPGDFQNAEKQG